MAQTFELQVRQDIDGANNLPNRVDQIWKKKKKKKGNLNQSINQSQGWLFVISEKVFTDAASVIQDIKDVVGVADICQGDACSQFRNGLHRIEDEIEDQHLFILIL